MTPRLSDNESPLTLVVVTLSLTLLPFSPLPFSPRDVLQMSDTTFKTRACLLHVVPLQRQSNVSKSGCYICDPFSFPLLQRVMQ